MGSTRLLVLLGYLGTSLAFLIPQRFENSSNPLRIPSSHPDGWHDGLGRRAQGMAQIGRGDRFKGGKLFPQGAGSRDNGYQFESIMNVHEVESAVRGLRREYGIDLGTPPYATHEGRMSQLGTVPCESGGHLSCDENSSFRVFLTSGMHGRERAGPDNLIYFMADLLHARKHKTGLYYGRVNYSYRVVLKALSAGIVFFPLVNPDGLVHDQSFGDCWQKNGNRKSQDGLYDTASIGVNLNRNFDFVWDYKRVFAPTHLCLSSDDPSAATFRGTKPFSEPETRNVAWVYERYPLIRWFMDVQSHGRTILHPPGTDMLQTTTPEQNFLNPAWDGKRGDFGDDKYREYVSESDHGIFQLVANRTAEAMTLVSRNRHFFKQSAELYASSGTSDGWAWSRHMTDPRLNKVYSFVMRFGSPQEGSQSPEETVGKVCEHYFTQEQFNQNVRTTAVGFMDFLLAASEVGY